MDSSIQSESAEGREPFLSALKPRDTARGALVGALFGAGALALYEAFALVRISSGQVLVALASAGPALVLASLGFIAALPIALAVKSVLLLLERRQPGASSSALVGAMVGSTFAVLGAQALVLKVLSGAGIRTATVALSAAIGVFAGAAIAAGLSRLSARIRIGGSLRARSGAALIALIATLLGAIALAPGFVEELDVPQLSLATVPLATGLVGAVWGNARRGPLIAALGAAAASLVLALLLRFSGPVPKLALHIERGSYATRLVAAIEQHFWPKELAPIKARGTCKPGVKPGPLQGERKAKSGAPDIVFITLDAVRWDHTSVAGYQRDTTPSLKRWAERAAVFSSAYSPSSATRSSFRALFSGLYPSQIPPSEGATWWGLTFPKKQLTLAKYLSDAGYRTWAGVDRREGFDPKKGGALIGFSQFLTPKKSAGTDRAKLGAERARLQISTLIEELGAPRSAPLFAWTHLVVAHQPYYYETPSPYGGKEMDRYDWAIHFADEQINQVLAAIEAKGRWNNTYVVLSADHGQAFGEHGNKLHGRTVYQEETNVPLMIWGPSVKPGVRKEPVGAIDVFPTLLELAGLGTAPHICGASLAPWLRDPKAVAARDVLIEKIPDIRQDFALAYVHDSYKMIVSPHSCSIEVFDLRKDHGDRDDLSDKDPALTRELVKSLIAYQRERGMNSKSYCLD